ncbi:MAG: cell division topological specificity factor MinE [Desulfobacteraceae bacterium]|nr:cell division topological specificity factor MinE [Desulfobacterales bacterium]MBS3756126.1 cell division topological specificity factor MinE [Desulfobacterales bacterium]MCF8036618.1 cell division topological specificity factor MinE [Desulfobacteraceae bacterium]
MTFHSLIKKLLNKPDSSRNVAKKRLQFALVYDKLEVRDDMLEDLQQDLVEVITRYFEIDRDALSLDIQRMEGSSALILNTPILAAKHRKEGGARAHA